MSPDPGGAVADDDEIEAAEVEVAEPVVARSAVTPDRLAELEEERRFLLRSLSDLEREHAAGDVDDADHQALRDGYTARAAEVLRAIDQGRSGLPVKPPRDWKRLIGVVLAVVVIGVGAGILVARSSGQRDPGDTITGGTSLDEVARLLSQGRAALDADDYGAASTQYLAVLDIEQTNVEALTYLGWVLAKSTAEQTDAAVSAQLLVQSVQYLDDAIAIDPGYADPHCFKALIAIVLQDDRTGAATSRDECLAANPSAEMRSIADDVTAELGDDVSSTDDTAADPIGTDSAGTTTTL